MKNNYIKVASHEAKKGDFKKCLLLYSGGLDTSVMLKWIKQEYGCEVVALTIDIGQTAEELEQIRTKALQIGAAKAIVYDAKTEFADKLLSQAIRANADYQGGYTLHTPLGRVIISEIAVKVAAKYDCEVIAHGCTGKGNDQVRFESYITTLKPELKIIAPVREWSMGRQEEIEYAKANDIPINQTKECSYSYDENMWGNSAEGGEIEDPNIEPNYDNILKWCQAVDQAPSGAEYMEIVFQKGIPTTLNGKSMELSKLIKECNQIGAKHGVGVHTLVEDRLIGLKVRGVYENPAGTILVAAHKKLEMLVSTRQENELKTFMDNKWSYLLYAAQWYEPTMHHINAYINDQNQKVTGIVKVKLLKGTATVVAVNSPHSMFSAELATFESGGSFNQNAAAGFIELYNLAQKTAQGAYNYEK